MADVVLTELSKVFPGGTVALDHVNLTVADGEFIVLVGPSGCGKSTLLRIVAGLEEATDGTVSIGGRVVDRLSPKAEREDQVHDIAHVLSLDPYLDRKPAALSGGQRQRVAMGRAMVRHPKVFLMDEPLSNLDAKLRMAMRGELIRLHQRYGTTTLYVTHDQVEAMTLGDRIAVLNAGVLQQVGTPDELYHSPCNVFVAGFIGSPAMNLAGATLSTDMVLGLGRYRWPLPESVLGSRPAPHDMAGSELIVGVRPHALDLDPDTDPDAPGVIQVTAVSVESLGSEKNVLFLPPFEVPQVTGTAAAAADSELAAMWTAHIDPDAKVTTGQHITLRLDLDAAYFFDARTGLAVPQAPVLQESRA